ncbi:MAG: hypothetical protein ABH950_01625 [Candidatus Altiarchaeota archaeon]
MTKHEIWCCMRCGSRNINHSSMGLGFHQPGGVSPPAMCCRDCNFSGNPIIFDTKEDYEKFLKEKKEETDKLINEK